MINKKKTYMKNIKPMHIPVLTALVLVFIVSGSSTTSKLEDGEILYNGMKLNVSPAAGDKAPGEMVSDMQKAVNVRDREDGRQICGDL